MSTGVARVASRQDELAHVRPESGSRASGQAANPDAAGARSASGRCDLRFFTALAALDQRVAPGQYYKPPSWPTGRSARGGGNGPWPRPTPCWPGPGYERPGWPTFVPECVCRAGSQTANPDAMRAKRARS